MAPRKLSWICLCAMATAHAALANPIHDAVKEGDVEKVKVLAKAKPDLLNQGADKDGTPLYLAVKEANLQMVGTLLDMGAKVDLGLQEQSPLRLAVALKYKQIIYELLHRKADVNATDSDGRTVLYQLVFLDDKALVERLLAHGAKIEIKDKQGASPLEFAMRYDATEMMDLLEAKGAKPNIFTWAYRGDLENVRAAIKKDSKLVAAVDWYGETPAHFAARYGHAEVLTMLLDAGAKLEAQDSTGYTPLHWANQKENTTKILLERGANTNARDRLGRTPLHLAISTPNMLPMFAKHKADINAQDNKGQTIVHQIVEMNNVDLMKEALKLKPDLSIKDKQGNTPLMAAKNLNSESMVNLLIEHGGK